MKKIITILLVTIMCAGILVGCGNNNSNAANNFPSHSNVSLDSDKDTVINRLGLVAVIGKNGDILDTVYKSKKNDIIKIGNTMFADVMVTFDGNSISGISYGISNVFDKSAFKDDFEKLKKDLTERYGEPTEIQQDSISWMHPLLDNKRLGVTLYIDQLISTGEYYMVVSLLVL